MARSNCGRPVESCVWQYFRYSPAREKTICLCSLDGGKVCGRELAGKNTTNLKVHLKTTHREEYERCEDNERTRKSLNKLSRTVKSEVDGEGEQPKLEELGEVWKSVQGVYWSKVLRSLSTMNSGVARVMEKGGHQGFYILTFPFSSPDQGT